MYITWCKFTYLTLQIIIPIIVNTFAKCLYHLCSNPLIVIQIQRQLTVHHMRWMLVFWVIFFIINCKTNPRKLNHMTQCTWDYKWDFFQWHLVSAKRLHSLCHGFVCSNFHNIYRLSDLMVYCAPNLNICKSNFINISNQNNIYISKQSFYIYLSRVPSHPS